MILLKNPYMEIAISKAKESLIEVPVGAVIVNHNTGKILATTHNQVKTYKDPTCHAEILAIKQACNTENNYRLTNCTLYVTLEPCAMCAGAILHARIPIVYFGAYDDKYGAIENKAKIFTHNYPHKPTFYGGIYESECKELIQIFFKDKR